MFLAQCAQVHGGPGSERTPALGDVGEVLCLAAGQVQLAGAGEASQVRGARERTIRAVPGDHVQAKPSGDRHPGALGQRRPDRRIPSADVGPGCRVDVEREEPCDLYCAGVEVPLAAQREVGTRVVLGDTCGDRQPVVVAQEADLQCVGVLGRIDMSTY